MAWAVDQLTIGNSGIGASASFTTNATVAADSWVFIYVGFWAGTALTGVSDNGPGLTYEVVTQHSNGNVRVGLARAYAPAGMASGTTITFTASGSPGNMHIGGSSFAGATTESVLGGAATAAASTAAHAVTVTTASADELVIECLHVNNQPSDANTPDGNSTELIDFGGGGNSQRGVMQYRIGAAAGNYTVGGTAGANTWAAIGASFDAGVVIDMQEFLPDADTTTTGWTATPLFSKVNDASDATLITATAS